MLKRSFGLLALLPIAAWIAGATDAIARSPIEFHHAALCNPKLSATSSRFEYSEYGVAHTTVDLSSSVFCGLKVETHVNTSVDVVVYDRHASQDVCCTVYLQSNGPGDETIFAGTGCSSGFGTLSKDIVISIPNVASGVASVECTLPPADPTNGRSFITQWKIE